jgi:hypothetical protein
VDITRKDATITNTDDAFPGSFEVILSAPTKDRDGDILLPDEWKQPLPSRITFDSDHGMSVASTVGSGVPSINDDGQLVVSGTYSSLPRAQEVRTLVNEGHINTTSVAFMSEKTQKDGSTIVQRELLNGAFVAIPSNREALVLSSKGLKAGARNSASDAEHIQAIHDHALALGATPATKALKSAVATAVLDEATSLLESVDLSTLPAEVQQAIALLTAAPADVEEPDEEAEPAAEPAAAEKSAAAATAADDAETITQEDLELKVLAMQFQIIP